MIIKIVDFIGINVINFINAVGSFIIFQISLIFSFKKFRFDEILKQIEFIGVNSLSIILLTGFFTGMVEAVELYDGFHRFGIESFMGYTIFLSICKELGPVFATLMVISRAISAIAAELGSMRVTEQIDALDVMAVDSKEYLVIPRMIATIISLPILILIFDMIANIGAYFVSVNVLGVNGTSYINTITQFSHFSDFLDGLIKGIIFGYFIAAIGTYIGYNTTGGAKGVGKSTTTAVVISAIMIFILDYIVSSILLVF